jgi:shikimate dehydrogenase
LSEINITSNTSLFGIIGYPVKHSLSPVIHTSCFQKKRFDAVYLAFEVKRENLRDAIKGIKALGIKGVSVTVPHKTDCMKHLDEIDEIARKIGAVNTIINRNGKLYGYNTDYTGVKEAFKKNGVNPKGMKVLMIGSGGAGRAVAFALCEMGISSIFITGIIKEEMKRLAEDIEKNYRLVSVEWFVRDEKKEMEIGRKCEIIVNASPVGMEPDVDKIPISLDIFRDGQVLFDVIYTPPMTKFLKEGKKRGLKCISGVDMFVYQAMEQFRLFTGMEASERTIRKILKEKIKK